MLLPIPILRFLSPFLSISFSGKEREIDRISLFILEKKRESESGIVLMQMRYCMRNKESKKREGREGESERRNRSPLNTHFRDHSADQAHFLPVNYPLSFSSSLSPFIPLHLSLSFDPRGSRVMDGPQKSDRRERKREKEKLDHEHEKEKVKVR